MPSRGHAIPLHDLHVTVAGSDSILVSICDSYKCEAGSGSPIMLSVDTVRSICHCPQV